MLFKFRYLFNAFANERLERFGGRTSENFSQFPNEKDVGDKERGGSYKERKRDVRR